MRFVFAKLVVLLIILLSVVRFAQAELTIEISQGVDNPTRIAVVPFAWRGSDAIPEDIAAIVAADLMRSGQFVALDKGDMLSLPSREQEVFYRDWRIIGQEYLLIGDIVPEADSGQYRIQYQLFDVYKQTRILGEVITGDRKKLRDVAHRISDQVYEQLTGIPGSFRAQTIMQSKEPILSPDWSPDGTRIAYVSFETRRPAIYIQNLTTGAREKVPSYRGLNSAPSWSPDGSKLALVLSRDGNPEIYIYDLQMRQLQRVTRHFGIDTEPSWAPDGGSLIFTSNRGGKPQIYRITMATGEIDRLTYVGDYNARGRLSKDGRYLVMVHQQKGVFHIAVQDLKRGSIRVLTSTDLDESPSIAPNGSMVIYATNYGDRGILAAVSVDGRVKFRLPSKYGDVREPAWSPY